MTDLPATNNQMSDQSIQTDVTLLQKPKVTVSDAKTHWWQQFGFEPIRPILSPKEEKPKFICNRGEFFLEWKKIKQSLALEEVSSATEIHEKVEPSLTESKGIMYNKLLETLLSMRDIQHYGTFILQGYEDPFMQKESARDESFKFFKFISPAISTWRDAFCTVCKFYF